MVLVKKFCQLISKIKRLIQTCITSLNFGAREKIKAVAVEKYNNILK